MICFAHNNNTFYAYYTTYDKFARDHLLKNYRNYWIIQKIKARITTVLLRIVKFENFKRIIYECVSGSN